jgi:phage portal protein BeeE
MDSVTQMQVLKEGVSAGVLSPDEARAKIDRKPVPGGSSPYLQQQNYSLEALAKRDAQDDPFGTATPSAEPANDDEPTEAERAQLRAEKMALLEKRVRERMNA